MADSYRRYTEGYAEGRRTALHLVVPLEDAIVYHAADGGRRLTASRVATTNVKGE